MNNKNKNLLRNGKKRFERNIKLDDKMQTLLNKIKSEKTKKSKSIDNVKQLEIELGQFKYVNNPNKLQSEVKESNKIQAFDKIYMKLKRKY